MKKLYVLGLSCILGLAFLSCSDEKYEPWEPTEVVGIDVTGVKDGVLTLYTTTDIKVGTHQLEVKYTPADATNIGEYKLLYTTSDTSIFTVDAKGLITVTTNEGEALLKIVAENDPKVEYACAVISTNELFPITEILLAETFPKEINPGETWDLKEFITINPENATTPKVKFSLEGKSAKITEDGILESVDVGEIIVKIEADDDLSEVFATATITISLGELTFFERSTWTATAPFGAYLESATVGDYNLLFDNNDKTQVAIVKPGSTIGGITVPKDAEIFFVVDMKEKKKFDLIQLIPRLNNTSANLRLLGASFYGSNDGSTFTPIKEKVEFPEASNNNLLELDTKLEYRYIKVLCTDWNKSGMTIQLSEMNVGVRN